MKTFRVYAGYSDGANSDAIPEGVTLIIEGRDPIGEEYRVKKNAGEATLQESVIMMERYDDQAKAVLETLSHLPGWVIKRVANSLVASFMPGIGSLFGSLGLLSISDDGDPESGEGHGSVGAGGTESNIGGGEGGPRIAGAFPVSAWSVAADNCGNPECPVHGRRDDDGEEGEVKRGMYL
jgi:hypothetical protein